MRGLTVRGHTEPWLALLGAFGKPCPSLSQFPHLQMERLAVKGLCDHTRHNLMLAVLPCAWPRPTGAHTVIT